MACEFVLCFAGAWSQRLSRLEAAIELGDAAEGVDAALSLKSGASMAGALRLAALASRMHQCFRRDGHVPLKTATGASTLAHLRSIGGRTVAALERVAAEMERTGAVGQDCGSAGRSELPE